VTLKGSIEPIANQRAEIDQVTTSTNQLGVLASFLEHPPKGVTHPLSDLFCSHPDEVARMARSRRFRSQFFCGLAII
jgi:hypothetical protein